VYNSINRQFISFFNYAHKKGKQNPLAVPFCRKGSHSHWHMSHMASVWDPTPIRPITTIQLDFPISVQWKYQMLVAYCPIFTVQSHTKKHVTKLYIQTIVLYHLFKKFQTFFNTSNIFVHILQRSHLGDQEWQRPSRNNTENKRNPSNKRQCEIKQIYL